jgi:salicylate hydroxylase
VVVIGAGVGGLTLALLLRQRGIDADVLERSAELRDVGAAVALSANGTRVLRHLGLDGKLAAVSLEPAAIIHRDGRDGRVVAVTEGPGWYRDRFGAPFYSVARTALQHLLADALGAGRLHLGNAVQALREQSSGVQVLCASGASFDADVVVGADGVHSMIRTWVTGDRAAPVYSGASGFRGLVPAADVPLPDPGAAQVWMGPGAHVVTYPVPVNGVPMINFLAVADEPARWTAPGWTQDAEPGAHLTAFAGWHPALLGLLDAVPQSPRWALFASRPQSRWSRGRITLLGDAAHAMLPHYGQGANQSIEDAAVLATELAAATDPVTALRRYERRRLARTRKLQKLSWDASAELHRPDGPAARQRDERLPQLAERMSWIHDYDALAPYHALWNFRSVKRGPSR